MVDTETDNWPLEKAAEHLLAAAGNFEEGKSAAARGDICWGRGEQSGDWRRSRRAEFRVCAGLRTENCGEENCGFERGDGRSGWE